MKSMILMGKTGALATLSLLMIAGCEWSSGSRDAGGAAVSAERIQPTPAGESSAAQPVVEPNEPVAVDTHVNAGDISLEHMDEAYVDHMEAARRLIAGGDHAAAMLQLGKALFDDDDNYQAAFLLGRTALSCGKKDLARKSFQAASRIDNQNPDPWIRLARLNLDEKNLDQARKSATKALAIDPRAAEAYSVIGRVWISRSQWEKAVLALRKAVALEPENRYFRNNLGFAFLLKKDYAGAIEQLEIAVRGEEVPAYMENNLGLAYEGGGRLREAISAFGRIVARYPRYLKARLNHDRLMLLAKSSTDFEEGEVQAPAPDDQEAQDDLIIPEDDSL